MDALTALSQSEQIQRLLRDVDVARLVRDLGYASMPIEEVAAAERLRVAAMVALAQLLDQVSVDVYLRRVSTTTQGTQPTPQAVPTFRKWSGYVHALLDSFQTPTVDDLILFAAAGALAQKPTEVRSFVRQPAIRAAIDSQFAQRATLPWPDRVRRHIGIALLALVQQQTHADVQRAGELIQALAAEQRLIEAEWLQEEGQPQRDSLTLLGLYHFAQAIMRISEFLLAGAVQTDGRLVTDVGPEIRRLLVRAEEYLLLSREIDTQFWLVASAVLLWQLRLDSIWVAGRGISERIDSLLNELASAGRPNPIFSLLPSQQDALRQSLLDPNRVAIVLQMPTSAGKTLVAEFAIVQAFELYRQRNTRVVYVAPTRALVTQVQRTLAEDLRPLGIEVAAGGGAFEEDPYEMELLQSTDGVIVVTPEKLDLMLRAHPRWFSTLRLIVVDEAHLLKDAERGVRLELLLANIRREQSAVRLLLLTPFVENADQIAAWLGESKGLAISVHWRPSRIMLGLVQVEGRRAQRKLAIDWTEPHAVDANPKQLQLPAPSSGGSVQTSQDRIIFLNNHFKHLGTVLAMFSGSRAQAEKAATAVASSSPQLPAHQQTPALRLAIALAQNEFGPEAILATCLQHGVAYHHSALSPMLRYLVEDQARSGVLRFIAATPTLAQGMNFPVATVLVHSVSKPRGKGNLSPGEFWNIAGRAGRVGVTDKGYVIFVNSDHATAWQTYSKSLTEALRSALLLTLRTMDQTLQLRDLYAKYPEIRPFLQYLAHAAAHSTPATALRDLEELLQASLANAQAETTEQAQTLRRVARNYLASISEQNTGYLKIADSTGLGSFSFGDLYHGIRQREILFDGPGEVLRRKQAGVRELVDVLKQLPELELAVGFGQGPIDAEVVARVVQGWIDGESVYELSNHFPGDTPAKQVRDAAHYLHGKVSQTISWGAHAYIRSWQMYHQAGSENLAASEAMLPAYIEYGVHTPEAAVASLLHVPRQFAEAFGAAYRENHEPLTPRDAPAFQRYLADADAAVWRDVVDRSTLRGTVEPSDLQQVWRQMQGLE